VCPNFNLKKWFEANKPKAGKYLQKKTVEILTKLKPSKDHDELISEGEAFLSTNCN
jgi:hypothetical protein